MKTSSGTVPPTGVKLHDAGNASCGTNPLKGSETEGLISDRLLKQNGKRTELSSDILLLEPPIAVVNHVSSQGGRSLCFRGHASAKVAVLGQRCSVGHKRSVAGVLSGTIGDGSRRTQLRSFGRGVGRVKWQNGFQTMKNGLRSMQPERSRWLTS